MEFVIVFIKNGIFVVAGTLSYVSYTCQQIENLSKSIQKYQQKAYCFHINKAVKDCRLHPPQYCQLGSYFKHSPFTCRYM